MRVSLQCQMENISGNISAVHLFKFVYIVQNVLKVALLKYLAVIIRRCQMCIEHAGQQFEQFL
jgi:hypothetical protein